MIADVLALKDAGWRCTPSPRCVNDIGARSHLLNAVYIGRGSEGIVVRIGPLVSKLRSEKLRYMEDVEREIMMGDAIADYPPIVAGVSNFWMWVPEMTPPAFLAVLQRRFVASAVAMLPPWSEWSEVLPPMERDRVRASVDDDYDEFAVTNITTFERFAWVALEQRLVTNGGTMPALNMWVYVGMDGSFTPDRWPQMRPFLRFLVHSVRFLQHNESLQHGDLSLANVLVASDGDAASLAQQIGYPIDDLPPGGLFPVIIDMGRATINPHSSSFLPLYPTKGFIPSFDLRWLGVAMAQRIVKSALPIHEDVRALVIALLVPPTSWIGLLWNPISTTAIDAEAYTWNVNVSLSFALFMRELLAVIDGIDSYMPGQQNLTLLASIDAVLSDLGPFSRFAIDHATGADDSLAVPSKAMRLDVLQPRGAI